MTGVPILHLSRRGLLGTALAGAIAAGTGLHALPAAAQDEAWPDHPLTIIVAFAPGGYNDLLSRAMAVFLQEELGQPVVVENRPGGGALLAHSYFLQQPDDGYTILGSVAFPYIPVNSLTQGADFTIDDFSFINLPRLDYTLVATAPDKPYETMESFIQAVKEQPGELSIGVGPPGSSDYINMILMLRALGLSEDSVRIVTYQGGNPLRLALAGGQVDVAFIGGEASIPSKDLMRPLMTFTDERIPAWDAPDFPEVEQALGIDADMIPGSLGGFAMSTAFRNEHPDRWEKLVAAFKAISDDPERVAILEGQQLSGAWIGPDRSTEIIREAAGLLEKHKDLLEAQ